MAQQQEKEKQQLRHVFVQDFIKNDADQIIGVRGLTWPERLPVLVTMDMDCEKAKNEKRPTFAKLAKGFRAGGMKYKLEKGSILRMRTLQDENGPKEKDRITLKTDWINPVSYNVEQTRDKIMFGLVLGKTRTPSAVWEKREEIRNSPSFRQWIGMKENTGKRKLTIREINNELEKRLMEAMPGAKRYYTSYYLYDPKKVVQSNDLNVLRKALEEYFNDPAFEVQESEEGRPYRAIKPHLIVRGLNEKGEYIGKRMEFMPSDAENLPRDAEDKPVYEDKTFKSPDECISDVLNNLPQECASWSIIQAKVFTHSLIQMEMGSSPRNDYAMKKAYELNADCHVKMPGEDKPKAMAIPMGLRLSSDDDKPCVTETIRDYRLERVDPVLVAGIEKAENPGEFDRIIMLPLSPEMKKSLVNREDHKMDAYAGDEDENEGLSPC